MNFSLLKRMFKTLMALTLIALFQNCVVPGKDDKGSTEQSNGLKCPIYLKPKCEDISHLRTVENEHGCNYSVCIKKNKLQKCATQSRTMCKPHQTTRTRVDRNSCFFSDCVLRKNENSTRDHQKTEASQALESTLKKCADLQTPSLCSKGQTQISYVDKDLCLKFRCREKKAYSCSLATGVTCLRTETVFTYFDKRGCAQKICKNTLKLKCPQKLQTKCKKNDFIKVSLDHNGCKKSQCIRKPTITKPGCSLTKPPKCKSWQNLSAVVLPNSCTSLKCL